MALESFPPFTLVAWRFLTSGSIMLAAVAWRGADDILRLARPHEPADHWSNAWDVVV